MIAATMTPSIARVNRRFVGLNECTSCAPVGNQKVNCISIVGLSAVKCWGRQAPREIPGIGVYCLK
jgi:hypothetical protein